mgnify:CR=1 FL=1
MYGLVLVLPLPSPLSPCAAPCYELPGYTLLDQSNHNDQDLYCAAGKSLDALAAECSQQPSCLVISALYDSYW